MIELLFNSVSFFITFTIMALIYYLIPHSIRWLMLLLFNALFYIMLMGDKSIILLCTGLAVYVMALMIDILPRSKVRSIFASSFVIMLIAYLLYYKYFNFIALNLRPIIDIRERNILTPIGISFYTLQAIGYLIDVYRCKIRAERHLGYFLVYLGFFGTILSGPIEKASNFLPQIRERKRFSLDNIYSSMGIILFGLFKKVVIADSISVYVDKVFNHPYDYSRAPVIFAILLYSIQLYADFSGYSLMAVGFSKLLGFDIINNFNFPYYSQSIREFWRRWHISFSTFLREYLYFSLGGSRVGAIRQYINTLVVFFISGIWHGANWTFIFWGTLHGVYIVIENILDDLKITKKSKAFNLFKVIITFGLVTLAWVFFRSDSIRIAFHLLKATIIKDSIANTSIFSIISVARLVIESLLIFLLFYYEYLLFKGSGKNKALKIIANTVMILSILLLGQASASQFIYFKF